MRHFKLDGDWQAHWSSIPANSPEEAVAKFRRFIAKTMNDDRSYMRQLASLWLKKDLLVIEVFYRY